MLDIYTKSVRIYDGGANDITEDARVVIEPEEKLPYRRHELDIRRVGPEFQDALAGWFADVEGITYTIVEADWLACPNTMVMRAINNTTTASMLYGEAATATTKEPIETHGANATITDTDVDIDIDVVFADVQPQDVSNESLTTPVMRRRCYLQREYAEKLRRNWVIETATTRYKVLSVHGLDDLCYLPWAVVEHSGLPR